MEFSSVWFQCKNICFVYWTVTSNIFLKSLACFSLFSLFLEMDIVRWSRTSTHNTKLNTYNLTVLSSAGSFQRCRGICRAWWWPSQARCCLCWGRWPPTAWEALQEEYTPFFSRQQLFIWRSHPQPHTDEPGLGCSGLALKPLASTAVPPRGIELW